MQSATDHLRFLKPAFSASHTRGFYAVSCSHLADGFGKIIAHGAFGEPEFSGDISAAHAFACESQDLPLAVGKRIHFSPRFGREVGMNRAQVLLASSYSFG